MHGRAFLSKIKIRMQFQRLIRITEQTETTICYKENSIQGESLSSCVNAADKLFCKYYLYLQLKRRTRIFQWLISFNVSVNSKDSSSNIDSSIIYISAYLILFTCRLPEKRCIFLFY